MTNGHVSEQAPDPHAAEDVAQLEEATGYKIYVRVPHGRHVSAADVQDFLTKFAELLSDEQKDVVVETYDEYLKSSKKAAIAHAAAPGGQHVEDAQIAGADGYPLAQGGAGSPLIPLYVCHHK